MMDAQTQKSGKRLPSWFKAPIRRTGQSAAVQRLISQNSLHTVCHSAACPNRAECWNAGTATFMILGDTCTRACGFCNVLKGAPGGVDHNEPERVARAVQELQLSYAVVTSVTRDDIPDGGASLFAATIRSIRETAPGCKVEVLIPDFRGSSSSLLTVLDARPDVLNHNIETVPSQYSRIRPKADYQRSLNLLACAHAHGAVTKTGIMLGLGETVAEIVAVMRDLRDAGCMILTLGQYLQPSRKHLPVEAYYHPDEFDSLRETASVMGFTHVVAGPLVRSSYHAHRYGVAGDTMMSMRSAAITPSYK